MTRVSLGEHSKIAVAPAERERLQTFYRDVLGCKVIAKSKVADLLHRVNYDATALSDSDGQKAIWLELRADHPEALREKILKFGIKGNRVLGQRPLVLSGSGRTGVSDRRRLRGHVGMGAVRTAGLYG